jgi:CheY-like chemotaxis protein
MIIRGDPPIVNFLARILLWVEYICPCKGMFLCPRSPPNSTTISNPVETTMSSNAILVVDDDPAILELISQILMDEGYHVLTASDGRTALTLARNQPPNLILLDLMMPEMNGWQVIAALQTTQQTRAIPVVLISARRGLAETASDLGVTAYLEKPFELDELLACVRQYIDPNGIPH